MKKSLLSGVFLFALLSSVFAQRAPFVAEGMGTWYDQGSGFYASHASLPFGTELIVTNKGNGKQVTVQVGGRIPQDLRWIIDISPDAANAIEMVDPHFTPVRIEQVVKAPVTTKALRTVHIRNFHQNGKAMVLPSGTELTAGHPSLPVGRQMQITNIANGQRVMVTVTNRIKASQTRIVEISRAAALVLGVRGTQVDVLLTSVDD